MSRPPIKALEQIKNYCEKTQCRRCVYGETEYIGEHDEYIGCYLQHNNPCDWEIRKEENERV